MNKLLLLCLLLIACTNSRQHSPAVDTPVDLLIDRMTSRTMELFGRSLLDSVGQYLDFVKDTVDLRGDSRYELYWQFAKIQQHMLGGNDDSAAYFIYAARESAKSKDIKDHDRFNLNSIMSSFYLRRGSYDSAFGTCLENYSLAKKAVQNRIATACYDLSELSMTYDDTANVRKYAFEAWSHREEEPELVPHIANKILYYYDRAGQLDSAIQFGLRFTGDSTLSSRADWLAEHQQNLGVLLVNKGRVKEGICHLVKAKELYEQLGVHTSLMYANLSEALALLRQFNLASKYADTALRLATESEDFELIKDALITQATVLHHQGKYKQAYAALDSAYHYFGKEMDSSFRKQAKEIETKYQVNEQARELEDLTYHYNVNRKLSSQQRAIIGSLIIIILLAGAIALLIVKRSRLRIKIKEAQLRQQLARTQMNSHFTFNVLAVLQSFLQTNKLDRLIKYLTGFSKLLRTSFENSEKAMVPLKDEIAALENYLQLQQLLYEEKFDYTIDNFVADQTVKVPPMILQPFVENSILKGFTNISRKGIIHVLLEHVDGSLHCIIEDNGRGLDSPTSHQLRKSSTMITAERLSILSRQSKKKARLSVTDKAKANNENGVRVELFIPV
jgi:Putative regulator of cell autolysis